MQKLLQFVTGRQELVKVLQQPVLEDSYSSASQRQVSMQQHVYVLLVSAWTARRMAGASALPIADALQPEVTLRLFP